MATPRGICHHTVRRRHLTTHIERSKAKSDHSKKYKRLTNIIYSYQIITLRTGAFIAEFARSMNLY